MPLHQGSAGSAGSALWRKIAPARDGTFACGNPDCRRSRSLWGRLRGGRSVHIQGAAYCTRQCMERILHQAVQKTVWAAPPRKVEHRIPLGLILLARHQLTPAQLQSALATQHSGGQGRIGERLQEMGWVSEEQVTAALARQWSCPVLLRKPSAPIPLLFPQIPLRMLHAFRMLPVSFLAATSTLQIAFDDGIDYSVLYAIEQMLNCHTQPCLMRPSLLRESLLSLGDRRPAEVVFERLSGAAEFASIVSNYATRISAVDIRLAQCRQYIWVRLTAATSPTLSLLLRMSSHPSPLSGR